MMGSHNTVAFVEGSGDFIDRVNVFIEKLDNEHEKKWRTELPSIYSDICEYQRSLIESIFRNAVDAFYSSYTPKPYTRTFGLYNVLSLHKNTSGYIGLDDPNFDSFYDESKMHTNRSGGDNLFDLVFKEGYHGGAKSIDPQKAEIWGAHPEEGVPYYRKHGYVTIPGKRGRVFVKYGLWGRKAKKVKKSPYKMISENMLEWIGDGGEDSQAVKELKPIVEAHLDKIDNEINANLPRITREAFSI